RGTTCGRRSGAPTGGRIEGSISEYGPMTALDGLEVAPSPLQPFRETAKLPQNLVAIDEKNLRRWSGVADNDDVLAGAARNRSQERDAVDALAAQELAELLRSGHVVRVEARCQEHSRHSRHRQVDKGRDLNRDYVRDSWVRSETCRSAPCQPIQSSSGFLES